MRTVHKLGTSNGFSLVELAIVLFIMGLVLQSSIEPLGMRLEHKRRSQATEQLRQVQQHLRAYWVSYGHLPCPVTSGSNAALVVDSNQLCLSGVGGVPAGELSIVGAVSAAGELLDPWGGALKYTVSLSDVNAIDSANTPDWLTPGEISNVRFTELIADLAVCRESLPGSCASSNDLAADVVAIVVSNGSDNFAREEDNHDGDLQYIVAPYSSSQPDEFDDQLIWLGRSELIYLALQAGWLP